MLGGELERQNRALEGLVNKGLRVFEEAVGLFPDDHEVVADLLGAGGPDLVLELVGGVIIVLDGALEGAVGEEEVAEGVLDLAVGAALPGDVGGLEDDAGGALGEGQRLGLVNLVEIAEVRNPVGEEGGAVVPDDFGLERVLDFGETVVGRVRPEIVVEVGAVVALRIGAAGADVAGVGVAEVFDELVLVLQLDLLERVRLGGLEVGQEAQVGGGRLGAVKRLPGVGEGRLGAVADLLVVGGCAIVQADRGEVEGNGAGGESEGVEASVELVELLLDGRDHRGEGLEFGDGAAVDAAEALVVEGDGHAAFAGGDPGAAGNVPEGGGVGLVRKRVRGGWREAPDVEREAVGERRDIVALGEEIGRGPRDAVPEPQFGELALKAAAESDMAEVERRCAAEGVERDGGEQRAFGVVERGDGRGAAARADDGEERGCAGRGRAEGR